MISKSLSLTLLAISAALALPAQGANVVVLTASAAPGQDPDANGGTVNAWTVNDLGGGGAAGDFAGDSAANGGGSGAGAGNPAWALFANTGSTIEALHFLSGGALTVGQTVSLQFDNGFVDGGGTVGLAFQAAGSANAFEMFFTGGAAFYQFNDQNNSAANTAQGFTADGFTVSLTLNDMSGGYTATVGTDTFMGTLSGSGANAIERVRVFNSNAGSGATNDLYFNNLEVTPEPTSAFLLLISGFLAVARRRR